MTNNDTARAHVDPQFGRMVPGTVTLPNGDTFPAHRFEESGSVQYYVGGHTIPLGAVSRGARTFVSDDQHESDHLAAIAAGTHDCDTDPRCAY